MLMLMYIALVDPCRVPYMYMYENKHRSTLLAQACQARGASRVGSSSLSTLHAAQLRLDSLARHGERRLSVSPPPQGARMIQLFPNWVVKLVRHPVLHTRHWLDRPVEVFHVSPKMTCAARARSGTRRACSSVFCHVKMLVRIREQEIRDQGIPCKTLQPACQPRSHHDIQWQDKGALACTLHVHPHSSHERATHACVCAAEYAIWCALQGGRLQESVCVPARPTGRSQVREAVGNGSLLLCGVMDRAPMLLCACERTHARLCASCYLSMQAPLSSDRVSQHARGARCMAGETTLSSAEAIA